ncbi:MAG: hypothetical protein BMS9Abin02_0865 [Anaerolineae bacterium]|nr:MAG: hypothetical protein BMS9Abin02_0865 [Anaerolineae bacterium]
MIPNLRRGIFIVGATIITNAVLILILPEGPISQLAIFLLLWIWPVISWSALLEGHIIERALLAAGLAILLNSLLLYIYVFIPGDPSKAPFLIIITAAAIAPLLIAYLAGRFKETTRKQLEANWPLLLLILLIALGFRLVNMGYKELQGDEGVIMVRAASVLTGDGAELFIHQKGPMEILIPAAPWLLGGSIEDFWARLPFVWAGLLVVAALYWLGRIWFRESVGLLAASLFALNGFGIAFSRIIQYQSIVILFGALALVAAWRYRQTGSRRSILLAALFLAGASLAHYDAILVAPAVAWVLIGKIREDGKFDYMGWITALLAGIVILALFYVPFFLGPTIENTFGYLLNDRLGSGQPGAFPGWSGYEVWRMSTFYNSLWYVLGLILLLLFGLWYLFKKRLQFAAVLYFLVPLVFYLFFVADPRTHVYTFYPGAVILAGLGAFTAWKRVENLNTRILSAAVIGLFGLWLTLSALYPYLMLVDTDPERQRTWAENRPAPALYPVTWKEPPIYGLFGFPHQAGWRAVQEFASSIYYPYSSNEEEEITNWYLAQADRTYCKDYSSFLLAENAQDEIPYDIESIEELNLTGRITVGGRDGIRIFQRDNNGETAVIEAANTRRWLDPQDVAPPKNKGEYEVNIELGEQVRLLGYDIDTSQATPGGTLKITLYWEALSAIDRNYQVFVHLYDGQMRAQDDGAPECAFNPTTRWEPGQIIIDPHIIELPEDFPDHEVPLLVGLYDLITEERLGIQDNVDNAILLRMLKIRNE